MERQRDRRPNRRRGKLRLPRRRWDPVHTLVGAACAALALALVVGLWKLGPASATEPAPQGESQSEALPAGAAAEEPASFRSEEGLEATPLPQPATPTPSPTPAPMLSEASAQAALNALREDFPEGWYWNHVGVEDWDEFTVTQTPCEHALYGYGDCNSYSGALQPAFPNDDPMIQCLGFAALLSDLVFGEDAPVTEFTDYTQLRVGDHIRLLYTEHSMTVASVGEDGVTVVECNSDYEHYRISWDRFLSWEDLAAHSYEMECTTRYADGTP